MLNWEPFKRHLSGRLIITDTETSGLPNKKPDPAEVWDHAAICIEEDGTVVDTWERMLRMRVCDATCDGAFQTAGLTHREVAAMLEKEGQEPMGSMLEFRLWVESMGDPPLTAFNKPFDQGMLEKVNPGALDGLVWGPCVMKAAMAIMGPAGKLRPANPQHRNFNARIPWLFPKQIHAAEFFGIAPFEPLHRAMADAKTATAIWLEVRRRVLAGEAG